MFTLVSYAIIANGGLSILIGLALLVGTVRFLSAAARTTGTVVGHERRVSQDSEGTTTFVHPVVEFEDDAGRAHRVTLTTGTAGYQPFPTGKRVEILYLPGDPARARIRHFLHLWYFPMALTTLGVIAVVFGVFFHTWTGGV